MSDDDAKNRGPAGGSADAEASDRSAGQRERAFKLIGATALAAILAVAVLIAVSESSGEEAGDIDAIAMMEGMPQEGSVLGSPDAELTLREYGDMRCPHCRDFARNVMPGIIEGPVAEGRIKVDFRNWPILGEQSALAARAAHAAGEQGRYWEYLESFYARSDPGEEMAFLRGVAEEAGVPDIEAWEASIEDPRWDEEIDQVDQEASELGLGGTPSFVLEDGEGELTSVDAPGSAADVETLIEQHG